MPSRLLNPRDVSFLLYELLNTQALTARARYAEHTRETFDAALETAARIAEERFAPHNRKSDLNEPRFENGRVEIIPEVREALEPLLRHRQRQAGRRVEQRFRELSGEAGLCRGESKIDYLQRHGFGGGRASHGATRVHRAPGSIGAGTNPSRVIKGKRLPGHMGDAQQTVRNLRVAKIDAERNLLYIRGAVPGPINGFVFITKQ